MEGGALVRSVAAYFTAMVLVGAPLTPLPPTLLVP